MSEVKVNKISPRSGTTITLGDSGDTFTIPSGVTLSNAGTFTSFQSTGIDDNATSTAITIDSGERVGIGTTNIPERLSISSGTGSACFIQVTNTDIGESDNNGLYLGVITDDLGYVGTRHNASLIFETNDAEAMRIDTSGNVGIGDTTPSAKLDVRSQINVTNVNGNSLQAVTGTRYGYSSAYRTILLGSTGTGTSKNIAIGYDPSSNTSGNFAGNGTEILFPNTVSFMTPNSTDDNYIRPVIQLKDGTVGIGESTPLGKFHIRDGDSATTSVDSLADELVVENSGSGGMTILTSASSTANIFFGDPNNNSAGRLQYSHSSNAMLFATNSSERMRIDSSGRVGIGESSPISELHITDSSDTAVVRLESSDTGDCRLNFDDQSGTDRGRIIYAHSDDSMRFDVNGSQVLYIKNDGKIGTGSSSGTLELEGGATYPGGRIAMSGGVASTDPGTIKFFTDGGTDTNPAERMRIDSYGNIMIGTTSTQATTGGASFTTGNDDRRILNLSHSGTSARVLAEFYGNGTRGGYIQVSPTTTTYATSSDYRLKENVSYDFDATTRLKQLKPARFNFIADANTTVDGFLAHEVSNIVPEAISGEKDALQVWEEGDELPEGVSVGDNKLDENGNTIPDYQGIDQSKLVPVLTKALQEAVDKIEQLEARITTLENA